MSRNNLLTHDSDGEGDTPVVTARSSPAPSSSSVVTLHASPHEASTSRLAPSTSSDNNNRSMIKSYYSDDVPSGESFYDELEHSPTRRQKRDSMSYYPPRPLKSNLASREAEFDLDSDELEKYDERHDVDEPLLMEGLLQSGMKRVSLDLRRGGGGRNLDDELSEIEHGGGRQRDRGDSDEEDDSLAQRWLKKGGGMAASIANMSNSILGAGIIGLPYALREAGFVTGLVLLVCLGFVTDWTIRLIVINAKMSGRTTYIDIMDTCFGLKGRAAVSFFQFAFAFGGMCAFCVILGDTIPHVLASLLPDDPGAFLSFLTSRPFVIISLTLGVSYPLSLYRDIEKLSKASTLALVSMVVIVLSVAVHGPAVSPELKGDRSQLWSFVRPGFFEAIGVISFAFVCHHNSLLIYGSLRTPTLDRFAQVTHISTTLSVVACLVMSTTGFVTFTNKTQGNILNNFSPDDTIINIARACFGANMFTTLPLEAFVCREVMETYFWPGQEFSKQRHVVITTALVLSALIVSLATCDLGLILELAGGFSATALAYIFPAGCYLSLTERGSNHRTRLAAWASVTFGVCVMILSTILSISKAMRGTSHKVCSA